MPNVINHRGKRPGSLATKLEKLYEDGLSVDEIAEKLGADRPHIYKMMRMMGMTFDPRTALENDMKVLRPMPNGVCYACEVYEPMGHRCGRE